MSAMTDPFLWLRLVHILSATVLFGTGLGIAFFMWRADRSDDLATIAATARQVVIADGVFTATAVVIQPVTGILLVVHAGYSLWEPWLVATYLLYFVAGACWLPVVWLQIRMAVLAGAALGRRTPLPDAYRHHMRAWFVLGWPAFAAVLAIYFLMVFRSVF
jgi:uncharacterized membrane protein